MKDVIIRLFLQLVGECVPLPQAHVVGLGGEGLEATLWRESGIDFQHGWLIERVRQMSRKLIQAHPYRYHSNLRSFATAFRSIHGHKKSIDALHADFCGTLESHLTEVAPVV